MAKKLPIIAITLGDPLGIGPEITGKALQERRVRNGANFVLIGPRVTLDRRLRELIKLPNIYFSETKAPLKLTAKNSGVAAIKALERAVSFLKSQDVQALVTAPISKERVKAAGFAFPGHTEFLCDAFHAKKNAMMLFHDRLRVVLTTIHVPLAQVPRLVTRKAIVEKLDLTVSALRERFGVRNPRVAVCGLNPHAGEHGLIGKEEERVITPAIGDFAKLRRDATISGPHSADTVFYRALQGEFDAVLCHYHDQALIPLKTTDFHQGVNMTLGLPFVRTSPDHGTAFDLAGKNKANASSMIAAILAAKKSV